MFYNFGLNLENFLSQMKKIILTCSFVVALLQLVTAQDDKLYKGAELYTKGDNTYLYGKIEVRMQAAKGSGILSSFYTFTDTAKDGSEIWEEVDLEIFGKNDAKSFQSNIVTDTPGAPNVEEVFDTGISLSENYHTYTVEWKPNSVTWKIDGVLVRELKDGKAKELTDPMSFHFNIWSSNSVNWVGPFDTKVVPVHAYVNWIKYYEWNGSGFAATPTWEDDFDSHDTDRWGTASWTFDVSNVDFDPQNANFKDGYLVLSLTESAKPGYTGTPPVDITGDVPVATTTTTEAAETAQDTAEVSATNPEPPVTVPAIVPTKPKEPAVASASKKAGGTSLMNNAYTNDEQNLLMFKTPVNAKTILIQNGTGETIKKIKDYRRGQSIDISYLSSGKYFIVVDKREKYIIRIEK